MSTANLTNTQLSFHTPAVTDRVLTLPSKTPDIYILGSIDAITYETKTRTELNIGNKKVFLTWWYPSPTLNQINMNPVGSEHEALSAVNFPTIINNFTSADFVYNAVAGTVTYSGPTADFMIVHIASAGKQRNNTKVLELTVKLNGTALPGTTVVSLPRMRITTPPPEYSGTSTVITVNIPVTLNTGDVILPIYKIESSTSNQRINFLTQTFTIY